MSQECQHRRDEDGVCRVCGDCLHEIILNGACYLCGATGVRVTVKETPDVVPADRLRRRGRD